jgi:L-fuconolactonase
MRIDAHQHFWHYHAETLPWISDAMIPLKRDFLPDHLQPMLSVAGFDGTVAVQAQQNVAETEWLLQLADRYSFIRGVVGWVDLCAPSVTETLRRLTAHRRLRGVRHALQDETDDRFMLRTDFQRGIAALTPLGLTYDILIHARQLPGAIELVRQFPQQSFVLDHIGKPTMRPQQFKEWRSGIAKLARYPNVTCKLSGMVTQADWVFWTPSDFLPYLDTVLDDFGTDRLMIGSDWPVCTLAGSYLDAVNIGIDYIAGLTADEQAAICAGNAVRIYGLVGGPTPPYRW